MSNVGKDLATATALDDNGSKVPLGTFWSDRKAVVVMIRHFDSASCRKLVSAMRDAQSEIEGRGSRLVVVGATQPAAMREFREAIGYRGALIVDPSLDAFRLAGMVPGAVTSKAAPAAAPAEAEPGGFFGRMKAALNVDVVKLAKMDVGDALTADLVKLGQQQGAPAAGGSSPSSGSAAGGAATHDSGVFVLGPGQATAFEWRAKAAGELPKIADLFAALPKK